MTRTATGVLTGLAGARLEHRIPSGARLESVVRDERLVDLLGSRRVGKWPTGSETGEAEFRNNQSRDGWEAGRRGGSREKVLHEKVKNSSRE